MSKLSRFRKNLDKETKNEPFKSEPGDEEKRDIFQNQEEESLLISANHESKVGLNANESFKLQPPNRGNALVGNLPQLGPLSGGSHMRQLADLENVNLNFQKKGGLSMKGGSEKDTRPKPTSHKNSFRLRKTEKVKTGTRVAKPPKTKRKKGRKEELGQKNKKNSTKAPVNSGKTTKKTQPEEIGLNMRMKMAGEDRVRMKGETGGLPHFHQIKYVESVRVLSKKTRANKSKHSSDDSDILLAESGEDSQFLMSSTMEMAETGQLLGFETHLQGNPFLRKNWLKQSNAQKDGLSKSKLKKTQSYRSFHSSNLELKQKKYGTRRANKRNQAQKKFHSTRNTLVVRDTPLEGICTDQSLLVPEEPDSPAMFVGDSDLLATQTRLVSDVLAKDSKADVRKSSGQRDSACDPRKSLQTIDLDEKELRSSIKLKTQRKLSKFKILDKNMSRSNETNMLRSIPPLEEGAQARPEGKLKKTFTTEGNFSGESGVSALNKSQSVNFSKKEKKKFRLSINKNIILEVSKENSPRGNSRNMCPGNEIKNEDIDPIKLISMSKIGDPRLIPIDEKSPYAPTPAHPPKKRVFRNKFDRVSISEDVPPAPEPATNMELIYKPFPTESDLLTQDDVFHDLEIDQCQPRKKEERNSPRNAQQEANEEANNPRKESKEVPNPPEKVGSNGNNNKIISLKESMGNTENSCKPRLSERNVAKLELENQSKLKRNQQSPEEQKMKADEAAEIENSIDQILHFKKNETVKKITFSTEKNGNENNNFFAQNTSVNNFESFFNKNKPEKQQINLKTEGEKREKRKSGGENTGIIKSLRSMSGSRKQLRRNRLRCTAPVNARSASMGPMFQSFREDSQSKREIDKEFMQTWISSGIRSAIGKLQKKNSLPGTLRPLPSHVSRNLRILPKPAKQELRQRMSRSEMEYAYGKFSKSQKQRGSIRSLFNPVQDQHSLIGDVPIKKKYSLRDNLGGIFKRTSKWGNLAPFHEDARNNSEYQLGTGQLSMATRAALNSSARNVIGKRQSGPLFRKQASSKKLAPKLTFKEDAKKARDRSESTERKAETGKSVQSSGEVYEYEFTFHNKGGGTKKAETEQSKEYYIHMGGGKTHVQSQLNLECPVHGGAATHVCLDCPQTKSLKCELCRDREGHQHVSTARVTDVEWLHSLSEKKSVNSFTLFEKLEKEFRQIREQLLKGLESMIVNYKKAILENSKEFLLKSLAYKAKRTQSDFFRDPGNLGFLRKLTSQINELSRLRNAPFIENAEKTTDVLIRSAVSFQKDLQLLMHTYSVTTSVVTPRIKDISKGFRRNLSEMITKIENENKSKKLKIMKSAKSSKRSSQPKKLKTRSPPKRPPKRKEIKPETTSPKKGPAKILNELTPKKEGTKNLKLIERGSGESGEVVLVSDPSQVQVQVSHLEQPGNTRKFSRKKQSSAKDPKIKLYKKSQRDKSSKDYSDPSRPASRNRSNKSSKVHSRNPSKAKTSRKKSEYYKMGVKKKDRAKKPKKKAKVDVSVDDGTSLSERSASIANLANKKEKKPRRKRANVQKQTPMKKLGALQQFMNKTNKFISRNQLGRDGERERKKQFQNEYDFHKLEFATLKEETSNGPKIYQIKSSNRKTTSSYKKLIPKKSASREMLQKKKHSTRSNRTGLTHYSTSRLERTRHKNTSLSKKGLHRGKSSQRKDKSESRRVSKSKGSKRMATFANSHTSTAAKLKELKKKTSRNPSKEVKRPGQVRIGGHIQLNVGQPASRKKMSKVKAKTNKMGMLTKLSSKIKLRDEHKKIADGGIRMVYSISELNKEIMSQRKQRKQVMRKKVNQDLKPLGFKMKNGLKTKYPSGNMSREFVTSSSKRNSSKSRREYMGNFF